MLKELKIANIILIEQTHIYFKEGFTVLSGETGAGKSAIIEALRLTLGARTDAKIIRHGSEKALVTAVFDLEKLPQVKELLSEKGVDAEDPNLLIVQREITCNGKTRASINHHPVQLSLLKELAEYLLELVHQHANHTLFHLDQHRQLLDLFSGNQELKSCYELEWKAFQTLALELQNLKHTIPSSLRELEICQHEIKEIEEMSLKEDEEETLFKSYSHQASSQERLSATQEMILSLGGERGVFSLLTKGKASFNALQKFEPRLVNELSLYPQIMIEVEELLHTLRKYESSIEFNPEKHEAIDKRLNLISKFKRKYGTTLPEINAYLQKQKERLTILENLEDEIATKELEFEERAKQINALAEKLTQARKKSAAIFAKKMTAGLHELNMKQAEFQVELSKIPLQANGQDKVEFFLHTNVGEKIIALKDSASGGELARVLLTLHVLLAGKEKVGTLIFDEIDANIGGTTASIMGEKLKLLGKDLQVITITHFPQVAKCADHHLQISKTVQNQRTFSQVAYLENKVREEELLRMSGV